MNKSETIEAITQFLFIGKELPQLSQYDLVLVLGNEQIDETINDIHMLIEAGHILSSSTIIFSGNVGTLNKGSLPEAHRLYAAAQKRE